MATSIEITAETIVRALRDQMVRPGQISRAMRQLGFSWLTVKAVQTICASPDTAEPSEESEFELVEI